MLLHNSLIRMEAFIGIAVLSFLIFNIACYSIPPILSLIDNDDDVCKFRFWSMGAKTSEILCQKGPWLNQKPVNGNTTLNVDTTYLPIFINLDESEEVVTLNGFLSVSWKNEFALWNSSEYEVSEITLNSLMLRWKPPPIGVYRSSSNFRSDDYYDYHAFDEAVIHSGGLVTLRSSARLSGPCEHDSRAWPFGQWNCRASLGRVSASNANMKLTPFDPLKDIDVSGLDDNGVWIIVSKPHFTVVDVTNRTIDVSFSIKRNSLTYGSSVILPGLVTVLLSLATFWLTDQILYRVIINTITATIQLALLLFMLWLLKESGMGGNLLMRFLENSTFISLMGMSSAIVNAKLMEKPTKPPKYMLRTIEGVCSVPYLGPMFHKFISDVKLVSGDDEVVLVDTNKEDNAEWKIIRVALDKCIFLLLVLYFLIFCFF